jgi:hypothetical protein
MERMRAAEAVAARDVIAQHLSMACKSIREKSATIESLRQQNKYLEDMLKGQASAYIPSNPAQGAQTEQPPPAGEVTTCMGVIDKNEKAKTSAPKEQPSSNTVTEEDPPQYEATEPLSQV